MKTPNKYTLMPIKPGLYEQIVTDALRQELDQLDQRLEVTRSKIDSGESHSVLAQYLGKELSHLFSGMTGEDKLQRQVAICNQLLSMASQTIPQYQNSPPQVDQSASRLLQIHNPVFAKHPKPTTPLSVSSLLTATSGDPSLVSQLKQEILHADRVDILVSFIKWSGIRIIKDELEEFTRRGRLRVITTSYLGATDLKAIEYLLGLPNTEVLVSFDTKRTRLHAKAYIFHRESGFGSAYVGSSNISNPAMTDGLEWNVKICQYETVHLWEKINATFETYQLSKEFDRINNDDLPRLDDALNQERHSSDSFQENHLAFFDISPYPYQQEILDTLDAERRLHNRYQNLVVAATGTGKTVIAAFDFKRFVSEQGEARLLFVAHRQEILTQSRAVFRNILRDQNFGELWVGQFRPAHLEQLFVSVQTLNAQNLWHKVAADFYDYIIIDEFHHAAAPSYQKLTNSFTPQILLGLTATPERADGQDILKYFNCHISAEIRLPDAINRKLLSPFQYFCISDQVDYSQLAWKRGGYDRGELESLLITGDDIRAKLIIEKATDLLLDVSQARGVCFCVSQRHAEYMARQFEKYHIPAMALTAETPGAERRQAISQLRSRKINFLCVVDLFNEGIDIPEIDTVLFLRPTASLTVFLQQLGRGLRRFAHNNSAPQLAKLLDILSGELEENQIAALPIETERLLTMFCFSIWNSKPPHDNLLQNIAALKQNQAHFDEALELIQLLINRAETVVHRIDVPVACPLSVHGSYTRDEILSGLGFLTFGSRSTVREGVKYLSDIQTDLFFVTLDKTEKDYSPTTMYKDYALDETHFHWQSQSTTSDISPTGKRYVNHQKEGCPYLSGNFNTQCRAN